MQCTPSDRVHCDPSGALRPNGCIATQRVHGGVLGARRLAKTHRVDVPALLHPQMRRARLTPTGIARVVEVATGPARGRGCGSAGATTRPRDTPRGPRSAEIVTHATSELPTPFHCDCADMPARSMAPHDRRRRRHAIPHNPRISNEKHQYDTKAQVRSYFQNNPTQRMHIFQSVPARTCEAPRTPQPTTETCCDLVKLVSAGTSLSPVPGFDQGSCVPLDP